MNIHHGAGILTAAILLTAAAASAQLASGASKFLGNITTSGAIRSDFLTYWNQITPENESKWASVEGTKGSFYWTKVDSIAAYATRNGIPWKFHTLVWGSQYPSWMDNLSTSERTAAVEAWIAAAATRYPNVPMIDVVNEPDNTQPSSWSWASVLGGDDTSHSTHTWVINAFKLARQHWPKATLILNDYNVLRWNTSNFIKIANQVRRSQSGLLDAIGCQAHGLETLDSATLRKTLKLVHDSVQVPIYITEYDLNIADDDSQKTVLSKQFPIFWESSYVAGVTMWGYIKGSTWQTNSGWFNADGTERPAMTWLRSYVASHLSVTSPTVGISRTTAAARSADRSGIQVIREGERIGIRVMKPGAAPIDMLGRK